MTSPVAKQTDVQSNTHQEPLSIGLPPVWQADAKVLILGSLPGVASIQAAQYYAHPRNQFWPMLQALSNLDAQLPYEQRLLQLKQHGFALWDLIAKAKRPGSLDSAIESQSIQHNDFAALLANLPDLRAIWFNGATAYQQWQKLSKQLNVPPHLILCALPSTSPAHASLSFAEKLQLWQRAYEQSVGVSF